MREKKLPAKLQKEPASADGKKRQYKKRASQAKEESNGQDADTNNGLPEQSEKAKPKVNILVK